MLKRLLERLEALDEAVDGIRDKTNVGNACDLDSLAVAKLLVFVDSATKRLGKLNDDLQPGLFSVPNDNGHSESEPSRATRRRKPRQPAQ